MHCTWVVVEARHGELAEVARFADPLDGIEHLVAHPDRLLRPVVPVGARAETIATASIPRRDS